MGLFKISIRTLMGRTKMFYLLLSVSTVSILLLILFNTTIQNILIATYEQQASKFGTHHLVYNNSNKKEINKIVSNNKVSEYGSVHLFGNYKFHNSNLSGTVGYFDKEALSIGNIQLQTGRLPKNKNEVAIEASYAAMLGIKLNTNISMNINSKIKKFKLVGIINDYSFYWTVPNHVIKGSNDFPNVLISYFDINEINNEKINYNLLLKLHKSNEEEVHKYIHLINNPNADNTYYNFNMYKQGLLHYYTISNLSKLFIIIFCLGTVICTIHIFTLFYRGFRKTISTLRSTGASFRHIYCIMIYQCLFLVSCSSIIAVPTALLLRTIMFNYFMKKALHTFITNGHLIITVGICLFIMILILVLSSFLTLRKTLNITISSGLIGSEGVFVNKNVLITNAFEKFSFGTKYFCLNFIANFKQKLLFILCISSSVFILFFAQLYAGETASNPDGPDYYLSSKMMTVSKQINDFEVILNQQFSFENDKIKQIEQMDGVQSVIKKPFSLGNQIILSKQQVDPFILDWNSKYRGVMGENQIIEGLSVEDTIVSNSKFLAVDDTMFHKINKEYFNNEISISKFKNEPSILLFYPISSTNIRLGISSNDKVVVGRIEATDHLEPNNLIYKSWKYNVHGISTLPFMIDFGETKRVYNEVIAVIHENNIEQSDAFDGYESIEIYLEPTISNKHANNIDFSTKELVAPYPGNVFQSKKVQSEDEFTLLSILKSMGFILFFMVSIYSMVSITIVIYSQVLVKLKEFSIFRVMGLQLRWLNYMIVLEMLVLVIFAFVISGVTLGYLMSIAPPSQDITKYMSFYFMSIIYLSVIVVIATFFPVNLLCKTNISKQLRNKE
ncbi:ABC transporter permease [Paenibacillus sp. UMB4589-SE434]|uniref:ABC transporter permease n=1 Tax=Paenibacillus sp. UMB4589-SE434 TaxID=3046314 RepID=UPI00254E0488|nr:ABC transporter permease [Paenibacillus sp. UMB4589-SE434]MDK8182594.1 ABC transporter permease [Paenibacillus sp. UMB4589-SE434]